MMSRAMLLGLLGLACTINAGTINAQEPDQSGKRAERVRAIQRQIMDLENIGRTRVLQERGPLLRPAVKTTYNVETFAPATARFVRFNVLATVNGAEPSLDALEIYGPDCPVNLNQGARTTASSAHQTLGNFNGGKYGKGFISCRKEGGVGWSAPAAIRVEGGSVGFQIGGSETDRDFPRRRRLAHGGHGPGPGGAGA